MPEPALAERSLKVNYFDFRVSELPEGECPISAWKKPHQELGSFTIPNA